MTTVPVVRYLDLADGTRWVVLFAGGAVGPRHLVFRNDDQQFIVEYPWGPGTSTEALREALHRAQHKEL